MLIFLSFLILFFSCYYVFLSMPLWDYDFWWHIATGRYILETGHVPDHDPFSFTSALAENKNLFPLHEAVILKNYWLSQIIFYLVYKTFGDAGMIFLRSSILLLILVLVFWGLKREKVRFYIIFVFLFMLFNTFLTFVGERPVLFSFLLSVIVFFILDSYRKTRNKTIWLLVPVMVLWANLHAGYMIGILIIGAFLAGETLGIIFKKDPYSTKDMIIFYLIAVSSILVTGLNPNGYDTILYRLSDEARLLPLDSQEYQNVFVLYWNKIRAVDFGYIALLVLSVVVLVFRARRMALSRIILLVGLCAMSLSAVRFMAFFMIIGIVIVGREIEYFAEKLFSEKLRNERIQTVLPQLFAVFILISSVLFLVGVVKFEWLKFNKAVKFSVPQGAVNFIEKNHLEGNIFNDFGFGGYLSWRLYPWKKNFVDTRWLNNTVITEYKWVYGTVDSVRGNAPSPGKLPLWERILDHYDIEIIFLNTLGIQGGVPPLLLKLLEGKEWRPVYADPISIVFVRDTPENQEIIQRNAVQKDIVYNLLIVRAINMTIITNNPLFVKDLGDIFIKTGRFEDAIKAYEIAASRLPRLHPERQRLESMKEQWKQEIHQ
ncbi:MAG: hypothetical protein ACOYVJ_08995 [Nitrospirota bacterium]